MDTTQDSIFTKIIKGEIPAYKIYEDEKVIAFLDAFPQTPGHTLVVPKVQVDHIWDLEREDYAYLFGIVRKLGPHIRKTLNATRVGVVVEGFGVPHTHVHLIPIENSDDLKVRHQPGQEIDHESLSKMAETLKVESTFKK